VGDAEAPCAPENKPRIHQLEPHHTLVLGGRLQDARQRALPADRGPSPVFGHGVKRFRLHYHDRDASGSVHVDAGLRLAAPLLEREASGENEMELVALNLEVRDGPLHAQTHPIAFRLDGSREQQADQQQDDRRNRSHGPSAARNVHRGCRVDA